MTRLDAIVVGAGPNGLAAAIELARAGRSVRIYEAAATVGGGVRSAELTLPGFIHDPCASVHPLSLASPLMRDLALERHGLEWVHPDAPVAHALAPGRGIVLPRDLDGPALDEALGHDAENWRRLFGALVREWERLVPMLLSPVARVPRHPVLMARFGLPGALPAEDLARLAFREQETRALFAGMAAHSMLPLHAPLSASFGLVLGLLAHAVGWPMAKGGSGAIASALEAEARSLGVEIETSHPVTSLDRLPSARASVLDLTPRQVLAVTGDRLPAGYRRQLERFRYGPGVFKIDWALDGPIPWADPATARAGTVHLGGPMREVAASEAAVGRGAHAARPFILLVQPTIADPSRAPEGKHVAWAYCHVPNGSTVDMTAAMESQVERFAPGFRDLVLARATKDSAAMEAWDANYVGGDINGGIGDWRQLLFRPVVRRNPYTTPDRQSSCAPRRPRPAAGCTGWAAGTRPGRRTGASGTARRRPPRVDRQETQNSLPSGSASTVQRMLPSDRSAMNVAPRPWRRTTSSAIDSDRKSRWTRFLTVFGSGRVHAAHRRVARRRQAVSLRNEQARPIGGLPRVMGGSSREYFPSQ